MPELRPTPEQLEAARALAADIVAQWFRRPLGAMDGWERWKPIWIEQFTNQFALVLAEAEMKVWERAAHCCRTDSAGRAFEDPMSKRHAEGFQYHADHIRLGPAWERNKPGIEEAPK